MSKNLKEFSTKQIEKELQTRREVKISELKKERDMIDEEIRSFEDGAVMNDKVVQKSVKSMKRGPSSEMSLKDRMIDIAKDGVARSAENFKEELVKGGWITSAKKPKMLISNVLSTNTNDFAREMRGMYKGIKSV